MKELKVSEQIFPAKCLTAEELERARRISEGVKRIRRLMKYFPPSYLVPHTILLYGCVPVTVWVRQY